MTAQPNQPDTLLLITSDAMGHGEKPLQTTLITTYFRLLAETDTLPGAVCFYADGVKLAVQGSPILDYLHMLEDKGVHLILCQTCLNYYNLANNVEVGIIGGMTDIIAAQWEAEKVITL